MWINPLAAKLQPVLFGKRDSQWNLHQAFDTESHAGSMRRSPGRSQWLIQNLDALRKPRTENRFAGALWRTVDEEFHTAIPMTEPDLLGSRREEQRFLLA